MDLHPRAVAFAGAAPGRKFSVPGSQFSKNCAGFFWEPRTETLRTGSVGAEHGDISAVGNTSKRSRFDGQRDRAKYWTVDSSGPSGSREGYTVQTDCRPLRCP